MSRTGTVAALFGHVAEPAVELNPADMARRGLADGDLVRVESRRGSSWCPLVARDAVARALLSSRCTGEALHSPDQIARASTRSPPGLLAQSKQPELKHAAARMRGGSALAVDPSADPETSPD